MKKWILLGLLIMCITGCDVVKSQHSKIVSPIEKVTVNVKCHTVLGVPFLCIEKRHTETDLVEIIEVPVEVIVEKIIEKIVIQEKIIEVPIEVIIEQIVETIRYVEIPIENVVYIAIDAVKGAVPAENINDEDNADVVNEVVNEIN